MSDVQIGELTPRLSALIEQAKDEGRGAVDWARARLGMTGTGSRCADDLECPTGWRCERGRCERPARPRLAWVPTPGGPL